MRSKLSQAGALTGYRERVYDLVERSLRAVGTIDSAVDVGAGEGWYAHRLQCAGVIGRVTAVELVRREHVHVEPILYDGAVLPMADRSAMLAYAVDAVHHANHPLELLDEMARVSSRWILLKDHTWTTVVGKVTLAVLDQLGNRRFGIPSPGRYQRDWEWVAHLRARGFEIRTMNHPARCQPGILGALTNPLQFVAVFERAHTHAH